MNDSDLIGYAKLECADLRRRGEPCDAIRSVLDRLERLETYKVLDEVEVRSPEQVAAMVKYTARDIAYTVGVAIVDAKPPEQVDGPRAGQKTLRFVGYFLKPASK